PVAGHGLGDVQAGVRCPCVTAVERAANAMRRLLLVDPGTGDVGEHTNDQPLAHRNEVELGPALLVLRDQRASLANLLHDESRDVRWRTRQALEAIANLRLRLLRKGNNEAAGGQERSGTYQEDILLAGLRAAVPALASSLTDPDPRARLSAVEILETLGPEA